MCISCVRQMCCNKLLAFDQGQKMESCKTEDAYEEAYDDW